MVLMMAGSELDPVFDSLAPVVALTHAVSGRLDAARPSWQNASGRRSSSNARTHGRGPPSKALVEQPWQPLHACSGRSSSMHDPFLWCMHDGRIVDPRRVCPHSMRTLLNKAARALQWRCVWRCMRAMKAFAMELPQRPCLAALYSSRLSAQEQAYLHSVVVDGQWTQRRKYRAAKTLSPLCALCGSEESSLIHRHFRCSDVQNGEASNMLGHFHAAAESGALWTHESFATRALLPALKRATARVHRALRNVMDKSTAVCSLESSTAIARPTRAMTRTCAWQVGVWWRTRALGQPVTVSGTLPFLIQDVDGAELLGLLMFLRIARAPAQHVTDSSFVEQGVNQRGRSATVASTSAWADLWRDVWCEIDAWRGLGDNLAVRKVKAQTTPEAVLAGIITADDRAGNDLAGAACKLVVFEAPRPAEHSRREALSHLLPSRAWRTGLRASVLRDSVWTSTRLGCLGVDERLREDANVSDEGTRLSTAPQGAFARAVSIQCARCVASV